MICSQIPETGVRVHIYTSKAKPFTVARSRCLDAMIIDRARQGTKRLVMERVDDGLIHADRIVINNARRRSGMSDQLRYDHVPAFQEPLLWISDCVAWAFGRDRAWRELVEPVIDKVVHVDP